MTAFDTRPSAERAAAAAIAVGGAESTLTDVRGPVLNRFEEILGKRGTPSSRHTDDTIFSSDTRQGSSNVVERSAAPTGSAIDQTRENPTAAIANSDRQGPRAQPTGAGVDASKEEKGEPVTVPDKTERTWKQALMEVGREGLHWALILSTAFCDGVANRMMMRSYSDMFPGLVKGDPTNALAVYTALKKGDFEGAYKLMAVSYGMKNSEAHDIMELWRKGDRDEAMRRLGALISSSSPKEKKGDA